MNTRLLCVLAVLVGLAFTARAVPVVDTNDYGPTNTGIFLPTPGSTFSDVFDISGLYNPLTQQITSASAQFYLWDAQGSNPETATVSLTAANVFFGSATNFAGSVLIDGSLMGAVLLDLQADGVLSYTITNATAAGGGTRDFYFNKAVLTAEVVDRQRVPDSGSSALLVALGLGSLFARRLVGKKR